MTIIYDYQTPVPEQLGELLQCTTWGWAIADRIPTHYRGDLYATAWQSNRLIGCVRAFTDTRYRGLLPNPPVVLPGYEVHEVGLVRTLLEHPKLQVERIYALPPPSEAFIQCGFIPNPLSAMFRSPQANSWVDPIKELVFASNIKALHCDFRELLSFLDEMTHWAKDRSEADMQAALAHSTFQAAFHDGQIVGFARLVGCLLTDVAVATEHRGNGIARRLVHTIGLDQAVWAMTRTPGLYEKLGFSAVENTLVLQRH